MMPWIRMFRIVRWETDSAKNKDKTDLGLNPIYIKNDDATLAHHNMSLLAYWLVNTIRCKLKQNEIHWDGKELIRIGNLRKIYNLWA